MTRLTAKLSAAIGAALVCATALMPRAASACGLELILAMDVSRSVVYAEYDLQMDGLAEAFRDQAVVDAITWTPGGIMVTVTQWSGATSQRQTVAWHHLQNAEDAERFAEAIKNQERAFFAAFTAVGEALYHAARISGSNPLECRRKVIDVSGDGASNRGRPARAVADALALEGYTINGLVILGARPDPLEFYERNVIRGPGAFVVEAADFQDYARAIREKLLREINAQFVEAR